MAESIETLNERLIEHYGRDTAADEPMWRIVKAYDQLEKRYGEYEDRTPSGLFIRRVKEVREVPKYRQWVPHDAYVLEHRTIVPEQNALELPATKVSYEPIFVYTDKNDKALPPIWSVTKIVIEGVLFATNHGNPYAKYKDKSIDEKQKEFDEIYDYLYGDRNDVTDALAYGEGVVVPNNYEVH